MTTIGTPTTASATRLLLLGSGELGREVALEAMRFGVEVIAVDRYPNAPAMQVAHRSHVISMLDGAALRAIVEQEKPDLIVPEIEAIATRTLLELEQEGWRVIPTARAANLTMNREGIRRLAAEELGLPTSPYRFAGSFEEFEQAAKEIGLPCLVKPVMSSSGKGQSMVKRAEDLAAAWAYAQTGGRGEKGRVIVEGFIDFDYEITQLTVMHAGGLSFCEPIGHFQEDGDYRLSWQPQPMSPKALEEARRIAALVVTALCEPTDHHAAIGQKNSDSSQIGDFAPRARKSDFFAEEVYSSGTGPEQKSPTDAAIGQKNNLGGRGIFGVELFIKGDQVWFSEVSPRPHDTGLVTCISQNLSEFALHARAILGLPVPAIRQHGPAASAVILPTGESNAPAYSGLDKALAAPDTGLMLFGKPEIHGRRRMGVALALGASLDEVRAKAQAAAAAVQFKN